MKAFARAYIAINLQIIVSQMDIIHVLNLNSGLLDYLYCVYIVSQNLDNPVIDKSMDSIFLDTFASIIPIPLEITNNDTFVENVAFVSKCDRFKRR